MSFLALAAEQTFDSETVTLLFEDTGSFGLGFLPLG